MNDVVDRNDIVVIDFTDPSCRPCQRFAEAFEQAARNEPGIVFGRVDIYAEEALARAFEVESVPTVAIYREQIMLAFKPGALSHEALSKMIDRVKALDMDEVRRQVAAEENRE